MSTGVHLDKAALYVCRTSISHYRPLGKHIPSHWAAFVLYKLVRMFRKQKNFCVISGLTTILKKGRNTRRKK